MNDIQILKLKSQGYCCSQIMVLMVLDLLDKENEDLVHFARGLCMGGGTENGACGILAAGMCILAMYAQTDTEKLALMQEAYLIFFQTQAQSGILCKDILGDHYPVPRSETCGALLSQSHAQLMAILLENGFDPSDLSGN
ncbi:MAG: DVU_1555 family C-GCAxxG-C-C protein [Pseudomonadota bacterium]